MKTADKVLVGVVSTLTLGMAYLVYKSFKKEAQEKKPEEVKPAANQ